jgi:hypothetical protein
MLARAQGVVKPGYSLHMRTQAEQDAHFMELALSQAERAVAGGQTPFGAVVVDREGARALAILAAFPWAQAAARAGEAPPAEASGDKRWRRFRATFEAALAAQLDGRPAAFKALWSRRPDVSILGTLDGLELGWPEVDARLDWVSERVRAIDLRLENLRTTVGADLAVTVDLERMRRLVDGQPVPRALRATQAYRLEDGEWKIFHRHADELRPSGRKTP